MKLDIRHQVLMVMAVLFTGVVLGGGAAYTALDDRIDALESRVDSSDTVHINYTGANPLPKIFKNNEESVVSIRAYGNGGAQGSGFVYSKKGYIITNEHVVDGAKRLEVTFTEGATARAELVGKDVYTDLAVLKVPRNGLNPVELGDSSNVEVGEKAIAIGNPFGLRGSMTAGIISQKGRLLPVAGGFSIPNVLQTDASINPGNSGGPLLNIEGEVVGVNTAIETTTGTFSGVGFAIPVNTVKRVVPEIIQDGEYNHAWIGVSGIDVGPDIAEARNLEKATGFLLMSIDPRGPAANSTLEINNRTMNVSGQSFNVGGDIITSIDGEKMRGITDILNFLAKEASVGEKITITVLRWKDDHNKKMNVTLELAPRPEKPGAQ